MMKMKIPVLLCSALFAILLTVEAGAAVRAEWGVPQDREVTFTMVISEAVPVLVIVRLHLPADLQIEGISPPPKKRDDKRKGLKLLFTNLNQGRNPVTLTTGKPVGKQSITGTVMYKDPATGTMKKEKIRW